MVSTRGFWNQILLGETREMKIKANFLNSLLNEELFLQVPHAVNGK